MRVVVTGASGNVGTSVLAELIADDRIHDIVAVCRRIPPLALPKVTWRAADVGTDQLEPILAGADAVIHLAWAIQPSRHEAELERTNVVGTGRVLDATLATGVPTLIHASSVGTYARGPKDRPVDETWPATGVPTSLYSRHKAATERLLAAASVARPDVRIVRLRTALVFKAGAGAEIGRLFLGPFVPLGLIGRHGLPVSPAFERLQFQVVHAEDAARAYVAALHRPVSGAFNIAAAPVLDAGALARALGARVMPLPAPLLRLAAAASYHARLQPTEPGWFDLAVDVPTMNVEAAHDELGWRPTWSATAALDDLLAGFAHRCGLSTPPLRPGRSGRVFSLLDTRRTATDPGDPEPTRAVRAVSR